MISKICDGKYIFRRGEVGDRCAGGWANPEEAPKFVLEYDGKQVGASHGGDCLILLVEIFDENKGRGTKFIELWEKFARTTGCKSLEVSPVSSEKLEHILENKCGFHVKETDDFGEKTYAKKI